MLKLIFDKEDVNLKKKIHNPKVETLRMARHILILCLSTLNLILPNSLTSQRRWRSCRGGIIDNIKLGIYKYLFILFESYTMVK